MSIADDIIDRLNRFRADLDNNITDKPPFTDDLYGPVRNLPPLEGDDLSMIKAEIERKLADGWSIGCVEKYMKFSEEICPFWAEDYALKKMKQARDRAIVLGAVR